jgi:hypothetical protein
MRRFALAAALAASLTAWPSQAFPQPPSGSPFAPTLPATPAPAATPASPSASTPSAAAVRVPAATPSLANLDLSRGELGKEPPGWYVPTSMKAQGYSATAVADHPEGSIRSALLQAPAGGPPPPAPAFGFLIATSTLLASAASETASKLRSRWLRRKPARPSAPQAPGPRLPPTGHRGRAPSSRYGSSFPAPKPV